MLVATGGKRARASLFTSLTALSEFDAIVSTAKSKAQVMEINVIRTTTLPTSTWVRHPLVRLHFLDRRTGAPLAKPRGETAKAAVAALEREMRLEIERKVKLSTAVSSSVAPASDSDDEIAVVRRACEAADLPFAEASHFADGGPGAIELAEAVTHAAGATTPFRPLYELSDSVPDKIRAVARGMYGAEDVAFTKDAERELAVVDRLGYAGLPICIAKTQNSLSDNPALRGRPRDFDLTVRSVQINAGAGFLVVLTGDIMRMPGLSRHPQAERIDLINGQITGLS